MSKTSPAVERATEHLHLLDAQTSLAQLTAKWPEYYWVFGRGKIREGEPMYGINLFVAEDYTGSGEDKPCYVGEHDNPDECVRGAVAWAETQDRKAEKCL